MTYYIHSSFQKRLEEAEANNASALARLKTFTEREKEYQRHSSETLRKRLEKCEEEHAALKSRVAITEASTNNAGGVGLLALAIACGPVGIVGLLSLMIVGAALDG